jgi:hypothetical protein
VRHLARGVPWPYPADGVANLLRDVIAPEHRPPVSRTVRKQPV